MWGPETACGLYGGLNSYNIGLFGGSVLSGSKGNLRNQMGSSLN